MKTASKESEEMLAQLRMQDDVIRRNRGHGVHDHLIRTAEARQRQAEALAKGVHWVWTKVGRALERLTNAKSREQTPAANGKQIAKALGRASVADAFRRDLQRFARPVRRFILEPYAHRRRRRIAIAQLRSLDDHLLADIGLMRGQIELAVDGMLPRRGKSLSRPVGRGVPAEPAEEARHQLPMAA
jgi:uncharacterized protein YjiS (DUF1127 family)